MEEETEEQNRNEVAKDEPREPFKASLFDRLWSCYPRKVGRGAALKSFEKINPDEKFLMEMILAIDAQIRYRKQVTEQNKSLSERNKKFIPDWPHPATWLNQQRWLDEIPSIIEEKFQLTNEEKCACGNKVSVSSTKQCSWCYSKEHCDYGPTGLTKLRETFKKYNLGRKPEESNIEYVNRCRTVFKQTLGVMAKNPKERTSLGEAVN